MLRLRSALYNLKDIFSGPPSYLYDNSAFVTLYPIDRILFPNINPKRDIIYQLFTSKNPTEPQILELGNDCSISNSNICFSNPTVIYFHGFLEGSTYGSAKIIHEAYMERGDHNLILVNAQLLAAGPWYIVASRNTQAIGKYTAEFIDYLVTQGLQLKKLHVIGHSLGGHMAGICGQHVKCGKVSRVTGLDPAKPFFTKASPNLRLDQCSGEFVDVIHTACGSFGLTQPIGHADFYPNGGVLQPGCSLKELYNKKPSFMEIIFCSHWRSVHFFAESIRQPKSFKALNAESWKDFLSGKCREDNATYMGFGTNHKARGNYYLTTNKCQPYSKC